MQSCSAVSFVAASVPAALVGSSAKPNCLTLGEVSFLAFYQLALVVVATHVEMGCF
jgi:hypothetical protein